MLVPVVATRDDVNRIDAVRVQQGFTEAGAIERAVVRVGLERHDAADAGVPLQALDEQLRAFEDFHGSRTVTVGSGSNADAR